MSLAGQVIILEIRVKYCHRLRAFISNNSLFPSCVVPSKNVKTVRCSHSNIRGASALTFKNLKKARCSHRDIRGASRMVYFSTYSFSFFRFIFRMSCFLENLKSHWSSLDLIDLLILAYISLLALFIFTANRLFVGEFLDAVASLAPTRAPGSQSVGWSVRHTSRFSLFWCLLNVIDL